MKKTVGHILFLIAVILGFVSCISSKDVAISKAESTPLTTLSVLNGTYSNRPTGYADNTSGKPLEKLFFDPFHEYEWEKPRDYSGIIRLEALSDKKLKVEYLKGDSIIETKSIKGKIIDNTFVMKRKTSGITLFPLFWSYHERKRAIRITPEGYLNFINGKVGYGGILFMVGGESNGSYESFYYKNEKIGRYIHTRTVKLYEGLAKKLPNKTIFYKTELNSSNSIVWYHQEDTLHIHHISPEGTAYYTALKNQSDEKEPIFKEIISYSLNFDKTMFGYVRFEGNKKIVNWINMEMQKLACYPYGTDNFIDYIRTDLDIIKQFIRLPYYYCYD